jgi:hypothetical protein
MSDEIKKLFSLENVIKFVLFIVTGIGLYYNLEGRVVMLEYKVGQMQEIRADIKEIKEDLKKFYMYERGQR